ncbi:uncharacterized protein [Palaemon carinicauda]|uniref:uncharacterized protein isoform X2 n=1 Tax=Palaemon carinicauda TaxID=392227 RepID=UPI0035B630B5
MDHGGYESEGKGKRKQHCTYCKNHGKKSRKTNHKCDHEHCVCLLCKLTRLSRLIMRHQQRLWRHLKDTKRRQDAADAEGGRGKGACDPSGGEQTDTSGEANGTKSTKLQKCDMCRNHGAIMSKRAHKNACPYQECTCELCSLTQKRRYIMRLQQRVRRSQVTSKQQQNEVYQYVTQATAELEFLNLKDSPTPEDQTESSPSSDSPLPSPDSSSTSGCFTLEAEVIPSNPVTPPAPAVTNRTQEKNFAPSPDIPNMPPLEPLPEYSPPRYSPRPSAPPPTEPPPVVISRASKSPTPPNLMPLSLGLKDESVMEIESAGKKLKRERDDMLKLGPKSLPREENLFSNLDFMRGHQTWTRRLEPPPPTEARSLHNSVSGMHFCSSHLSPFKSVVPIIDGNHLPPTPLKKTRTDENLHFQYNPMFWGSIPVEPRVGFVPEDFQQQCYHSLLINNTDLRMQPPPGLIQMTQPQHPVRPRPLAPIRHHSLLASTEWDRVNFTHYLSHFLQTRGGHYRDTMSTLSATRPFGLPREAPFLHHPVP